MIIKKQTLATRIFGVLAVVALVVSMGNIAPQVAKADGLTNDFTYNYDYGSPYTNDFTYNYDYGSPYTNDYTYNYGGYDYDYGDYGTYDYDYGGYDYDYGTYDYDYGTYDYDYGYNTPVYTPTYSSNYTYPDYTSTPVYTPTYSSNYVYPNYTSTPVYTPTYTNTYVQPTYTSTPVYTAVNTSTYTNTNTTNNNNNTNNNSNTVVVNTGGGGTTTPPNNPPNNPPQRRQPFCQIDASDATIDEGDSTTLRWSSDDAYSATLSSVGSVSINGSRNVSPDRTTTYTLTVRGEGGNDSCSTTVHVEDEDQDDDEDAPFCDLSVSPSRIEEGDSATLRWDTDNATSASINEGIGSVNRTGGSERVSPDEDTTYRMTVRGPGGTETCSVTLRVDDEDNDFSSIVFTGEETQNPPPTVYLSDLPYTGLEDIDPTLMSFYLLLIAGAGVAGYFFVTRAMPFAFAMTDGSGISGDEAEVAEEDEDAEVPTTEEENAFVQALTRGETEAAFDMLRVASYGVGVEEFLASSRAALGSEHALASRLDAAIVAASETGIRGAKAVLA